jgi:hypothetical protein
LLVGKRELRLDGGPEHGVRIVVAIYDEEGHAKPVEFARPDITTMRTHPWEESSNDEPIRIQRGYYIQDGASDVMYWSGWR